MALNGFFYPTKPLGRIVGRECAHKYCHLSALGEQLDDLHAQNLSGLKVVGSDVKFAIGICRIRVVTDEDCLCCRFVELRHLILGGFGADGDSVVALRHQIFQDLVLLLHGAVGRHFNVHLNAGFFFILMNSGGRDIPEIAGVVGDKRELQRLAAISIATNKE